MSDRLEIMKFNAMMLVIAAIVGGAIMMYSDYYFITPLYVLKNDILTNTGLSIVIIGILIFVIAGIIQFRQH
jgi:hypothetical protein